MAEASMDWVLPALQGLREHISMAEESRKPRMAKGEKEYLPGHDKEGPPGHSLWDGIRMVPNTGHHAAPSAESGGEGSVAGKPGDRKVVR